MATAKTVLVIDPTHKDGDLLTEKLRAVRKDKGLITGEEKAFTRLTALGWTDAQKGDASRYGGDEVIQFFRNSGPFKAGDRVKASELLPHLAKVKPEHFAVFGEETVNFAVGDTVRITGNGWDVSKKHRVDNGRIDEISGFTRKGDMVLSNGWVVGKDFGASQTRAGADQPGDAKQNGRHCAGGDEQGVAGGDVGGAGLRHRFAWPGTRHDLYRPAQATNCSQAIQRGDNRRSATELLQREEAAARAGGTGGKPDAAIHGKGARLSTGNCSGKLPRWQTIQAKGDGAMNDKNPRNFDPTKFHQGSSRRRSRRKRRPLLPALNDPYKAAGIVDGEVSRLVLVMGKDGFRIGHTAYIMLQYVHLGIGTARLHRQRAGLQLRLLRPSAEAAHGAWPQPATDLRLYRPAADAVDSPGGPGFPAGRRRCG